MMKKIPETSKKNKASIWRSLRLGLYILIGLLVFAYGFQVTEVNLQEFRKETRQASRVRVTRNLAQPDIFEYDYEETIYNAPFYLPCPVGEVPPQPDLVINSHSVSIPDCAESGGTITIEGHNFPPLSTGYIYLVPSSDPNSTLALHKGDFTVDREGYFIAEITLPSDRDSSEVQYIRIRARAKTGAPHFSENAIATWDKIIETVLMALLATTLGTVLAIPMSFLAARNLMKDVKSPLTSIALSLLGWPIGIFMGFIVTGWLGGISLQFSNHWGIDLLVSIVSLLVILAVFRWVMPRSPEIPPGLALRLARLLAGGFIVIISIFTSFHIAGLAETAGNAIVSAEGMFAFLGNFVAKSADILITVTPAIGGMTGGWILSSFLGRMGQRANERLKSGFVRILNIVFAAAAGTTIFTLFGAAVKWLYEIEDPLYTFTLPAIVGGALGLLLAFLTQPKKSLQSGLFLYYVTRTILNAIRSVEALVMAIVFVIWVGIGPFAGVLALGLHTVVSLAKLYSEQVESILPGPLEAIEATGANRLQTILYAVVPQIIPPYISYTMYRWDINVRMSTIIGFVGGGGIGFLLQQNIGLLNYNSASTQMLAIAVVVALMDYISSVLREKYV